MLFCIFVAILATLIWINLSFAQFIEAKINPYSQNNDAENKRAIIKNYLIVIMAIFWAIVLRY